ncbi:MAG: hypothetical protein E7062_00920 [Spirochaetaceae bacterium]|nr:hypothetical protein [Spirochaetaceae bacterium]
MKKLLALMLILLVIPMCFAQEVNPPAEPEFDLDLLYKMNQKGDQFIKINLFVDIPFQPSIKQLHIGGAGALGFHHFIADKLSIGGDLGFNYSETRGSNIYYFIPVLFRLTYQFEIGKFEIPLSLGLGGAFQTYSSEFYFGLLGHPELGFYWRINPEWSFGGIFGCYLIPQWYKQEPKFYLGVIPSVGLSVRYHF